MKRTALALSTMCLALLAAGPARAAGELARGVRMKISAGDFPSAEAMVEDHARGPAGKDGEYLAALAWLSRGALLLGKSDRALALAKEVRAAIPAPSEENLTPLGAAIEVEGRLLARRKGPREAARFFEGQRGLSQDPAFQSRLSKNVNLLTLVGEKAPEIAAADWVGPAGGGWKGLAAFAGKPVVLFLWAHWCGDCKAQAASLARIRQRYEPRGVVFVAPTRFYGTGKEGAAVTPAEEKAHLETVLAESYGELGALPVPISTEAMIRYGGSSTPTFVTIDKTGIVRSYDPTRLTEAELAARIEPLLK